jgi:hypothetical protein
MKHAVGFSPMLPMYCAARQATSATDLERCPGDRC